MVQPVLRLVLASLCLVLLASSTVNGRYLPTRSNEDSLDKLRDLLRDILDSDKPNPQPNSHLAPQMYDGAGHYASDRYAFGGPKYLRKREVNGWDFYDPSSSLQKPLH